jgi:hypothetical protein
MHPYFYLLPVMLFLQALITPEIKGYRSYFTSHGAFNNSCPVAQCRICNRGEYRVGCANASGGVCTNCTPIAGAVFTTHGWFNNSCDFTCGEGYIAGVGRSCQNVSIQYTINFVASVTLPNSISANTPFNMTLYINTVSKLVGCGGCGDARLNPTVCGVCKIFYSLSSPIPVVYRRLLSTASVVDVNTSIVILDNRPLALAAMSKINSSIISSQLFQANLGTISVGRVPTLRALVVNPTVPSETPKPPPPVPPSTTTDSSAGESNTAAIVGGVVGGVAGFAIIILLVVVLTRNSAGNIPPPTPAPFPRTNSRFKYRQAGGAINTFKAPKPASQLIYVRKNLS